MATKKKKKTTPKKSTGMAVTKKRRKSVARSSGARTTTKRRRPRSRGLSAPTKIMSVVKPVLAGGAGGIVYAVGSPMIGKGARPWVGLGLAAVAMFMGMNNVGAGMAGAASAEFTRSAFGLADDGDTEYVSPTILSENYQLSESETMDDNGNVYQLSDNGSSWEYVGTIPNLTMLPEYGSL